MDFKLLFFCYSQIIKEEIYHYKWPEDWESLMWADSEYSTVKIPEGYVVDAVLFDSENNELHYFLKEVNDD